MNHFPKGAFEGLSLGQIVGSEGGRSDSFVLDKVQL